MYDTSMNNRLPDYVKDLYNFIEGIPYGDVDFSIKRQAGKTFEVNVIAEETLRYVDNDEALKDLNKLVSELIETRFSGETHIKLQLKNGSIQLLGIFNKKEKKY